MGLNRYSIEILCLTTGTTRDHIIKAMTAADALTIAEKNLCVSTDAYGQKLERLGWIEALPPEKPAATGDGAG